jgi:hypothetical protein
VDWKWTVTAVLPVITLVLGGWLNQRSEERRESAALRREESLRQLERDHARLDRRESFELTHLVDLYEALNVASTAAVKFRWARWSDVGVDEHGRELSAANRKITSMTKLVLDADIRAKVQTAQTHVNEMALDEVDPTSDTTSAVQAQTSMGTAQEAIAERLREIYGPRPHPLRP